jgi:hypothetical protein
VKLAISAILVLILLGLAVPQDKNEKKSFSQQKLTAWRYKLVSAVRRVSIASAAACCFRDGRPPIA